MEELISIVSIIFSALAAIFWLLSALVHTPGKTKISMGEIQKSMKRQSILNAIAAFSACIVAIFQFIAYISPYLH